MSNTSFSSLNLPKSMLANLDSLGYTQMTAIQEQALPELLQGKDLIAKAKTGSGKNSRFWYWHTAQVKHTQLCNPISGSLPYS